MVKLLCIHCLVSTYSVPVPMMAMFSTRRAMHLLCSGQSRPLEEQRIPLGVEGHITGKLKRIQREPRMVHVWATPLSHIFQHLRLKGGASRVWEMSCFDLTRILCLLILVTSCPALREAAPSPFL